MNNSTLYDVIGDIHGQADKLEALLRHMGYRQRSGAWSHPSRKALFVGDYVDRGPGQLATLDIVRRMTDKGHALALMGNHEFNAIAWHTPDTHEGDYLRKRTLRNRHQHAAFLAEVGEDSSLHQEWVSWFKTLPLWLDLPGIRAIHACWHPQWMKELESSLGPENTLTDALMEKASRSHNKEFHAVEALVKGLEIDLPHPVVFVDAEGTTRRKVRVKWWDEQSTTYRSGALLDVKTRSSLPDTPLPSSARVMYDNKKPLFFGHYWMTGEPRLLTPMLCCVDYSAARPGHPLVAYRWNGESELSASHLVAVGAPSRDVSMTSSLARNPPRL